MGVTIHYTLGQKEKYIPKMLDRAEHIAREIKREQADKIGIEMQVERRSPHTLAVHIGHCETLLFDFNSIATYEKEAEKGYSYEMHEKDLFALDTDLWYASAFCKTQYGSSVVCHKWVADIIRAVASQCRVARVYDEGDYYHTLALDDATEAIDENGKIIASVGDMLAQSYGAENIVKGGDTKIKKRK
jgi:hypothetical protein